MVMRRISQLQRAQLKILKGDDTDTDKSTKISMGHIMLRCCVWWHGAGCPLEDKISHNILHGNLPKPSDKIRSRGLK